MREGQQGDTSTDGAPPGASYGDYFGRFLPGLRGRLLMKDLRGLTASFEVCIMGVDDPPWRIRIERGTLQSVGHNGPEPECCFELDSETLLEVVGGGIPPQEAFFDMRIEVEGDIELGLKLGTVLEPFFETYPYPQ